MAKNIIFRVCLIYIIIIIDEVRSDETSTVATLTSSFSRVTETFNPKTTTFYITSDSPTTTLLCYVSTVETVQQTSLKVTLASTGRSTITSTSTTSSSAIISTTTTSSSTSTSSTTSAKSTTTTTSTSSTSSSTRTTSTTFSTSSSTSTTSTSSSTSTISTATPTSSSTSTTSTSSTESSTTTSSSSSTTSTTTSSSSSTTSTTTSSSSSTTSTTTSTSSSTTSTTTSSSSSTTSTTTSSSSSTTSTTTSTSSSTTSTTTSSSSSTTSTTTSTSSSTTSTTTSSSSSTTSTTTSSSSSTTSTTTSSSSSTTSTTTSSSSSTTSTTTSTSSSTTSTTTSSSSSTTSTTTSSSSSTTSTTSTSSSTSTTSTTTSSSSSTTTTSTSSSTTSTTTSTSSGTTTTTTSSSTATTTSSNSFIITGISTASSTSTTITSSSSSTTFALTSAGSTISSPISTAFIITNSVDTTSSSFNTNIPTVERASFTYTSIANSVETSTSVTNVTTERNSESSLSSKSSETYTSANSMAVSLSSGTKESMQDLSTMHSSSSTTVPWTSAIPYVTTERSTLMSSSGFALGQTSSYIDVTSLIFSNTARLETLFSSVPVSVFTSGKDSTTTICYEFPRDFATILTTEMTSPTPISPLSIIRSNQSSPEQIANALVDYFNQTNRSETLTPNEIDYAVSRLNITFNSSMQYGFLMSEKPLRDGSSAIVGAIFLSHSNGQIVLEATLINETNRNISAGGVYGFTSFEGLYFVRMLLIDSPIEYRNVTDNMNRTLASSVVVANLEANTTVLPSNVNISLFLRVKTDYVQRSKNEIELYCAFYDSRAQIWNDSGCSRPIYNMLWDRHECFCSHLTSFALIWLPVTNDTQGLNAQDITSLVFQCISIVCFLGIIGHSVFIQTTKPNLILQAKDCLPLLSNAVTMLLFIFYIALTLTVYMSTESKSAKVCFLRASVLMFIFYFLLILTFCTKTSIAYFNYVYFVHLFPPPSFRKLYISMSVSLCISVTYVIFAIGFNSNSSLEITQLYSRKICWFTRHVLHPFVTAPICACLALNIVMLIFVGKRLFDHARHSTSRHKTYNRMKQSALVMFGSCITQGVGWLSGPFLSFADENTAQVLGWIFVVCNALEGLWTLVLYYLLRKMKVLEQARLLPATEPRTAEPDITVPENDEKYERRMPNNNSMVKNVKRKAEADVSFDDIYVLDNRMFQMLEDYA